ncbi:hypothetical protein FRC12_006091 [Ceratobasidium sp. 428]|nr:hypothetical protein FRC12_006091 [Ceratobasidium sp. 428]
MVGYILENVGRVLSTIIKYLPQPSELNQDLSSGPGIELGPHVVRNLQELVEHTAVILLIGRCGSGKTFFIETACSDQDFDSGVALLDKTMAVATERIVISEQRFKLIDTPGFDNPSMSNFETFSGLARYLLHERKARLGIAGVVYIHRAGDPLESRALAQNLGVLFDVFLGDSGLSRLTIMVVPDRPGMQAPNSAAQALSRSSVFRPAISKGAKVLASTLCQVDIDSILLSYTKQGPVLLRAQQELIHNPRADIRTQIEERLGYYENDSMKRLLASHQDRSRLLESTLKEKDLHAAELSDAYEQIEQQLGYSHGEVLALRQQLQQTQKEYASLRSQLQVHENIEQGDIVQALKDLNRSIDDLGRLVSEYLVDTYVQAAFGKEPSDVSTLEARHLDELKALLEHVEGQSSLVTSSDGSGMPVEDFLDYATRALLCKHLSWRIFGQFHPAAESSRNETIAMMYEDVQRREPQAVAGRWRANSFKSICEYEDSEKVAPQIGLITQELADHCFVPLLSHFFGPEAEVSISDQCSDRLTQLVRTAWDWNLWLKGEVIMLGDFRLTYYPPSSQFEPNSMNEFEPNRRNPHPHLVAGTLGLGLLSFRAVGGGEMPEKTIVYKATVATESLYV